MFAHKIKFRSCVCLICKNDLMHRLLNNRRPCLKFLKFHKRWQTTQKNKCIKTNQEKEMLGIQYYSQSNQSLYKQQEFWALEMSIWVPPHHIKVASYRDILPILLYKSIKSTYVHKYIILMYTHTHYIYIIIYMTVMISL